MIPLIYDDLNSIYENIGGSVYCECVWVVAVELVHLSQQSTTSLSGLQVLILTACPALIYIYKKMLMHSDGHTSVNGFGLHVR